MRIENTDLERRVLAHEEILQALLAQLTERDPGFLDQMRDRFASARRGAYEHDYVETADYAEAFIHEVMRLVRVYEASPAVARARVAAKAAAEVVRSEPSSTAVNAADPVAICTTRLGNVWHVTRNKVFYGDYLTAMSAQAAATKAMRAITDLGGLAKCTER
jgi:hypothetical protein